MLEDNIASGIREATVWVLPFLFAVPLHEAAHGLVAYRLGDDTAYRQGRVTLNPLRHVDPFGTVILPALLLIAHVPFLFGYAKPVPVAFHRLRHPRRTKFEKAVRAGGASKSSIRNRRGQNDPSAHWPGPTKQPGARRPLTSRPVLMRGS